MEYISTSKLANELDIPAKELFSKLMELGWINRLDDKWTLTQEGEQNGGQIRQSNKYGEYIVWPENLNINTKTSDQKPRLLNATSLGKHFNISSQRMNLVLSELGWIEKHYVGPDTNGWSATKAGVKVGGRQFEHEVSGGQYVLWPSDIVKNKFLNDIFSDDSAKESINTESKELSEFRTKYPANHRSRDGHFVRSRAEIIIDDALYEYGVVHAYERKIPVEEEIYCDFYLPQGKVYIEFWGMESEPRYQSRKKQKIEIYKKHELNLIELNDNDILNLDDILPKKLSKYGIKVY
jgi:hypothetical protein